ncbi:hypothetical protein ACJX0J_039127, partial [Zea mays]
KTLPAAICCEQEHIAKRLGQCPLAAKVLGSRLCRKKDIAEWKAALKIGDLSDPFTSLLGASCIAACFQKMIILFISEAWSGGKTLRLEYNMALTTLPSEKLDILVKVQVLLIHFFQMNINTPGNAIEKIVHFPALSK